eukprot:scaffold3939_cov166-Amphora_coffeaeformis.AAC.3
MTPVKIFTSANVINHGRPDLEKMGNLFFVIKRTTKVLVHSHKKGGHRPWVMIRQGRRPRLLVLPYTHSSHSLFVWHHLDPDVAETIPRQKVDSFVNGGVQRNPGLARCDITFSKESIGMIGGQHDMNGSISFVHHQLCGRCRSGNLLQDQFLTSQKRIEMKIRVGRRSRSCQTNNHGLVNGLRGEST